MAIKVAGAPEDSFKHCLIFNLSHPIKSVDFLKVRNKDIEGKCSVIMHTIKEEYTYSIFNLRS